jgi:CDP-glucose 4,6-dehydratase
MGLTPDFWQGRRVVVTGHTGFKGGWLTLWLRQLGAEVTGFALEPATGPSLFKAAKVEQGIRSIIGDIRNFEVFSSALRQAEPEIVFHLAAQPLVLRSYEDPIGTYATNVMGTVNLLAALRDLPTCRSALIITTDKCYENREWHYPYRETDVLGGYDPYSSSKACAELAVQAFRRSYFSSGARAMCIGTARAGNVIGGGDWAKDRLMVDAVIALAAGLEVPVRNPAAERPWQHVLEPVFGYLKWAEMSFSGNPLFASEWNFGPPPSSVMPVASLMDRVCGLWGDDATWRVAATPRPHEAGLLRLDPSKAERGLGWRGRLSIDEALDWSIAWYRAFYRGHEMQEMSLCQIAAYDRVLAAASR